MLGWMSAESWGPKRMTETTGAYNGGAEGARSGMMAGTRVATGMGWRAVEDLGIGDMVLTFDAGLQRVTKVTRRAVWNGESACPKRFCPLTVPAGALGNRDHLTLLPCQYLMIESDAGEDLFGDPFSLITAMALSGVNGIQTVQPAHGAEAIVLHFENDQVVFADGGVLFYCPSAEGPLDQATAEHSTSPYKALDAQDADVLVMCIESEREERRMWDATENNVPAYVVA